MENISLTTTFVLAIMNGLYICLVFGMKGPPANSDESIFEVPGVGKLTVEQYFDYKAKSDTRYQRLRFPSLPTVDVTRKSKAKQGIRALIPMELVEVLCGQTKRSCEPAALTAQIIKFAAVSESFNPVLIS